jgi:very-short-patch-repair endonuclease
MPNNTPTEHEKKLVEALRKRGVDLEVHKYDGHKTIDIYIPRDNLYIEVDGMHHITNPDRIISDFNRDYFSFKEGFFTKHITNEAIDTHLEEIADAIAHVAKNAPNKIGENLSKALNKIR